jgi:hypothetical protein
MVSGRAAAAYRRTEITLETDQVWIIRKSRSTRGWCAECGREVDMVGLKEARALLGKGELPLTPESIPGCGGSRGWHCSQAPDGSPLICLESALKSKKD